MIKKELFKKSICSALLVIFLSANCNSQTIFTTIKDVFSKTNDEKTIVNEDIFDLTLEENIENPSLGKYSDQIISFQREQDKSLKKNKYNTELIRGGEVIKITIPAKSLFGSNDTILKTDATKVLLPLVKYFKISDLYRMVLAMHTDNTGTENYTYNLSRARVESIFKWLESQQMHTDYIIPYALGSRDPLEPNNSMANRTKNRRLEIYLVPGKAMIQQAKKGSITLK